jgi:hypothetical protein
MDSLFQRRAEMFIALRQNTQAAISSDRPSRMPSTTPASYAPPASVDSSMRAVGAFVKRWRARGAAWLNHPHLRIND